MRDNKNIFQHSYRKFNYFFFNFEIEILSRFTLNKLKLKLSTPYKIDYSNIITEDNIDNIDINFKKKHN